MDLTDAEDIKKRWQEYTEELFKNDINNPDNSPRDRYPGTQSGPYEASLQRKQWR